MSGSSKPVLIALAGIAVLLWLTGIVVTFSRTVIPYGFQAERVVAVVVHREHNPGRDDAIQVRMDRRTLRIDPSAEACLKVGERVSKPAWSMIVTGSDGGSCVLRWPRQLVAVAGVPIMIAAGSGGLLLLVRRLRPRTSVASQRCGSSTRAQKR